MGDEEIAEYALALRELVVNSKPVITSLTMLAGEITGKDYYLTNMIVSLIEKHIRTNSPKVKLTGFYLLDSVCKNVKGHFISCFDKKLANLFLTSFATQDATVQKSMTRLLGTWGNVFSQTTLGAIQRGLSQGAVKPPGPPGGGFTQTGALPPPPMNATVQGSLLASMLQGGGDVSALLKSIANAKARAGSPDISQLNAQPIAAPSVLPPPPAPPSAPPPSSTIAAAEPKTPSIHDLPPLPAGFDPVKGEAELRKRREKVIDALYSDKPFQCAVSGARFKTRQELDAHLDLQHVRRRNKKAGVNNSRAWFVDSKSWIQGAAAEQAEDKPAFFEDGKLAEEAREAAEKCSVVVDESQPQCALSGEPFETFWNAEEEEWHYKGAVILGMDVGNVSKGSYVLFTAVPKEGEGVEDEDNENDEPPELEENKSPVKRKRAAVKSEPAEVKLEQEDAGPAKRRSGRR